MHSKTDQELVALARSGDKGAFGELIERYQGMARRIALRVVGHDEVARELAQEAMLQAYLSLDRLRDADRFQSWLYGIVLNVCRSYLRDDGSHAYSLEALTGGLRFEATPFTGVEPGPQEAAEARELHETVLQAVQALSPKNRAATLLFYYEQLSVREIAATLDVSVAAVKGRLHKSKRQLRELLLPLYSESHILKQRRVKEMVKVTIADVVPSTTHGMHYVVVLLDETGRRVLPIWVGQTEGMAIATSLRDVHAPRPMTHTFTALLLEASGVSVDEVRIEELKGDTFYAVAKVCNGDQAREVDARPSDAITLAVVTGSPIFAAEDVMQKASQEIPPDVAEAQPQGKGIDSIAKVLSETWSDPAHDLISYVFGSKEVEPDGQSN